MLLAGLIAVWLIYTSIAPQQSQATVQETDSPKTGQETATVSFKATAGTQTVLDKQIKVEKGTNAFEAMQLAAEVGYQETAYGPMVETINGASHGTNQFWALYLNGEMAMVGINGITIDKDTTIEWKTEDIESYS